MPMRSFPLEPTPIRICDEVLDDLRRRLTATKWPLDAGNDDGYYGVRRSYLAELVAYWADGFDCVRRDRAVAAWLRILDAADESARHELLEDRRRLA